MKVVVEVVHWVGMGNEGNFRERDWQNTFYGGNYERLRGVQEGLGPGGFILCEDDGGE